MSTAPMNVEPWTVAENLIVASPVSAICTSWRGPGDAVAHERRREERCDDRADDH